MLLELSPRLTGEQRRDLLSRLEHENTKSALAAEMELALLWAVSTTNDVTLHAEIPGTGRRPEAFAPSLFSSGPAYIEITSVSDDTFSDQDKMDRVANIVNQYCETIRRNSSKNLHYTFKSFSGAKDGRYQRYRLVSSKFYLTDALKQEIATWVGAPDWPRPLSIANEAGDTQFNIEWREYVHQLGRTFSSMPAVTYDLEANPVFKALRRKREQLSGVPKEHLRCIFLADVGCYILRRIEPFSSPGGEISGARIIRHFLSKNDIDFVVVFSAVRKNSWYGNLSGDLLWNVQAFHQGDVMLEADENKLKETAGVLPRPRYEGYQARSLHQQRAFEPQATGQYLGSQVYREGNGTVTVRFSARLLQELLAKRITFERFEHFSRVSDSIDYELRQGKTIAAVNIEKAGIDQDDDVIAFVFSQDPSASSLK